MLARCRSFCAALVRRRRVEREMEQEWQFHLEARMDALVTEGLSRDEARRRARMEFGDPCRWKEEAREVRGLGWRLVSGVSTLFWDGRASVRSLRRRPGWASAVVLVLATGVGLTTSMFAVTDPFLLKPLPYRDPDRLAVVRFGPEGATRETRIPRFADIERRSDLFEGVAAYGPRRTNRLHLPDRAVDVTTVGVTEQFLATLGLPPQPEPWRGSPEDSPIPLIVTHRGRERLGTVAVGDVLRAEQGRTLRIVGLLPETFIFPVPQYAVLVDGLVPFAPQEVLSVDRWTPEGRPGGRGASPLAMIARLPRGVAPAIVRDHLAAVESSPSVDVFALSDYLRRAHRPLAFWAMAAGLLILLVCAGNAGNLLLARTIDRATELSTRTALGATCGAIVRLYAMELALLTAVGVGGGLVVSWQVLGLVRRVMPDEYSALGFPGMTLRAVCFSCAAGIVTAAIAGAPALMARLRTVAWLGTRDARVDRRRLQSAFMACQASFAMILAILAGVLVQSYVNLTRQHVGFDRSSLVVTVSFPVGAGASTISESLSRSLDRLRRLPGVVAAGASPSPVVDDGMVRKSVVIDGVTVFPDTKPVTSGFFAAAGLSVVQGRGLRDDDGLESIVVTQSFARTYWASETALGRTVVLRAGAGPHARVVGVVRDVFDAALDELPTPTVFVPLSREDLTVRQVNYVVKLEPGAEHAGGGLARVLREVNPALVIVNSSSIGERLWDSVRSRTFPALILGLFGVAGCVITGAGIVAIVASAVARRRREIAIRLALGATSLRVWCLAVADAAVAAAVGATLGWIAGRWLSTGLGSLAYGVAGGHWAISVVAGSIVVGVMAASALVTARASTRVSPASALNAE